MASTTKEYLDEALAAQHALMTGRAAVEVRDADGTLVRYNAANATKLAAYISKLQADLAAETSGGSSSGPLRIFML